MRRSQRNTGGYRGRGTLTDLLKLIAVILAILILLVFAALVFGQQYIVYSDAGVRLELPIFQKEEEPLPEIDLGNIQMIERPADVEEPTQNAPEEPAFAAVTLELTELPVAAQRLQEAGANAVILEMKDAQGKLYWESGQELAESTEVNGTAQDSAALEQWLRGDVYTVAKVCCFRDNTIPYHRNNMALRATYGNWRDELGLRWMNPAAQPVQAYLWELCHELAQMGFDEILLECYAFPELGTQESITTQAPNGRTQAAVDFLTQMRRAANEKGVKLSLLVEPGVLEATETAVSGLNASVLLTQADCLWVEEEQAALAQTLLGDEAEERLVRLVEDLSGPFDGRRAQLKN